MKKSILITVMIIIMVIGTITASALDSPTPIAYYNIQTEVAGTGNAVSDTNKVEIGSDGSVTFTATETTEKFVFWNIKADDYDIISGDYDELVFTIRPKSDVVAIATFDDGVYEHAVLAGNTDTTSPKTGDRSPALILICLLPLWMAIILMNIK